MAADKRKASSNQGNPKEMTEASPNPHNEAHISEMPVKTDHRSESGTQNIARNPNMRDGRLNPSVAEGVAEPNAMLDDDSMFNSADPQVTTPRRGEKRKANSKQRREETKPRKTA